MSNYCTLAQARIAIKATSTGDDEIIRDNMRIVTKRIDLVMGSPRRPFFAPYVEQRQFKISANRINTWENVFWLNNHIVAFTAVLRGTTTMTTVTELYEGTNEVAQGLRLTTTGDTWYSSNTPPAFVKVTGTWCYHDDWANAWDSVDTVKDLAGINATVTTITVDDVDGEDLDNFTPRFSAGNLIKIGTEYIEVLATDTATNIMTVRRGRNGTTAAVHALNAAISVFRVDERIRRIAARQVALLYARRGAFQVETLDGVGAITYPQDLMTELKNTLAEFIYA